MLTFDELYAWVKNLPIVDWHNHLDFAALAADRPLGSLYEVWVKADPYKHRAMRICGEPERLITGTNGTRSGVNGQECPFPKCGTVSGERTLMSVHEDEKWAAWMRTLPKLVGNPIFAWAKMELAFLGLDPTPYLRGEGTNVSLANWTPSRLLQAFKVESMSPCTTAAGLVSLPSEVHPPRGADTPVRSRPSAPGNGHSCPFASERLRGTDTPVRSRPCVPGERTLLSVHPYREFPDALATSTAHFSPSLRGGTYHARNLPHVVHDGSLVFLTFRLADSLPREPLLELERSRQEWIGLHPQPWSEEVETEYDRTFGGQIEKWLDAGQGACLLRDPACRKAVVETLETFNETGNGQGRYVLHAYVVMPNHVHVVFKVKRAAEFESIVKGWKGVSARRINEARGTKGQVWQEEYFDRLIRDAEHYGRTLRYTRQNAEQAYGVDVTDEMNGQECPFPGNGPKIVPSLRMNAGEEIAEEVLEEFQDAGCRVVDISVDDGGDLERCFDSLARVAGFAARHGWMMLLHLGALRATSARLKAAAGPAGGYAGMRAPVDPELVAKFLNRLEAGGDGKRSGVNGQECPFPGESMNSGCGLPRTILLSLNPEAHAQLAVLAGSFNEAGMPGKVQLGPAWWWCDHQEGILDVLEKNAAYGVLSTFVGMTTDSRSLLSFVRHDYFRRILCRWVAQKIAAGDFPDDAELIRPLLENICYRNARAWMGHSTLNTQHSSFNICRQVLSGKC